MEIINNKTMTTHHSIVSGEFSTCDSSQVEIVLESITGITPRVGYSKYYSWSMDKQSWSTRIPMLGTVFPKVGTGKVWIRLYYEMENPYGMGESITIKSVIIQDKGVNTTPKSVYVSSPTSILGVSTTAVSATSKILNSWIQATLSTPVTYWKITGVDTSRDVILNEFGLYTGSPGVCLGVHIKDNIIPTEKPEFKDWGLDWEQFEIEVLVSIYKETFGQDSTPTVGDFLYIATVNRMYSVVSYYVERAVDGTPQSYVMKVSTYEGRSTVINTSETTNTLESVLTSPEDIFGEELEREFLDTIAPMQTIPSTVTADATRSIVLPTTIFKSKTIMNGETILSKSQYDWSKSTMGTVGVVYSPPVSLSGTGSIGWGGWIALRKDSVTVSQIGNSIKISGEHPLIGVGTKLSTGGVIVDGEAGEWKSTTPFTGTVDTIPTVSIGGIVGQWSIITSERGVEMADENFSTLYVLPCKLDYDTWYGIVVSISNVHKYLGIYVWELGGNLPTYKKEFPLSTPIILDEGTAYLPTGVGQVTNIRVLSTAIPMEHHRRYYGGERSPDASGIIIEDRATTIGNSRQVEAGVLPDLVPPGTPL